MAVVAMLMSQAQAADAPYDWSDEAGAESAKRIIVKCLDEFDESRQIEPCEYKPSDICVTQFDNGSGNQRAQNQCAYYSGIAWGQVVDDVYARLVKSAGAPKDIAKSQSMWSAWNEFDCHTISDYDGTRASMDYGACKTRHAAARVFELLELIPHQ
ncbi:lysozyme inhibitor LprI family protein [Mesorhizobium sp. NZP2298]|uniref:lysozyme inhibitor LprI family protein n=1 Tax=Mesorhizobium sp. NZP2298 TaxID=2483403 RepID=UPI0015523880|nr:lysozyme inhibitor LprI family protein [Mesorhizobium sp. NZP2298]